MPFPLRADFAAVGARCRAKKIKDGPQARRLLALAFAPGGRRRPRSAGDRVDGAPTASRVPRWMLSKPIAREAVDGESTPEFSPVTRVGLDPVKNAFQVRAVDAVGQAVIMRALKRGVVQKFFGSAPHCLVTMEACSSAQHWARQLLAPGFEATLIPPAHVKPYVRRNTNDRADAAIICATVICASLWW